MNLSIPIPNDPEAFLTITEASFFLAAHGHPLSVSTLMSYASRGFGPPRVRFRGRPYYLPRLLLEWIEAQKSAALGAQRQREIESRRLVRRAS